MIIRQIAFLGIVTLQLGGTSLQAAGQDPTPPSQDPPPTPTARDITVVETLLRLPSFDLNSNAAIKASVDRYLDFHRGKDNYFALVEKLSIESRTAELLELALTAPTPQVRVSATRLLDRFQASELVLDAFQHATAERRMAAIQASKLLGGSKPRERLVQIMQDGKRPAAERIAAIQALGASAPGQQELLRFAQQGSVPETLIYSLSSILRQAIQPEVRAQAEALLPAPTAADDQPLPELAKLVRMQGDPQLGAEVFRTKGTCAKCHQIGQEGKEVGPNLAEIGSKLSREALFVSILDPSAAISHNYESVTVLTVDGLVVSGILISDTDNSISIRNAEAVTQIFPRDEVEQVAKQTLSLMPNGLQKNMTLEELVSLVDYLATLKKQPPRD